MVDIGLTVLIVAVALATLGVESVRLHKIWLVAGRRRRLKREIAAVQDRLSEETSALDGVREEVRRLRDAKHEQDVRRKILDERIAFMRKQLVTFVHPIDGSGERRQRFRFRIEPIGPAEGAKDLRWFKHFQEYCHVAETWAGSEEEAVQTVALSPHTVDLFAVGVPVPPDQEAPE